MLKKYFLFIITFFICTISNAWDLPDFSKLQIELYQSQVNEKDIDEMVTTIQYQYAAENGVPFPKLDIAFFSSYGEDIFSIEKFRSEVESNMEREVKDRIRLVNSDAVFQTLRKSLEPYISEIKDIKKEITEKMVTSYHIKVNNNEIEKEINKIANIYTDEKAARNYIMSNEKYLNKLRTGLLHEKITTYISQRANITYVKIKFGELANMYPRPNYYLN